jgi:hypothetical protein
VRQPGRDDGVRSRHIDERGMGSSLQDMPDRANRRSDRLGDRNAESTTMRSAEAGRVTPFAAPHLRVMERELTANERGMMHGAVHHT